MKKERKNSTVKPELLGGFNDYLPETMIPRQEIIATIKKTYESFGFLPLETPGLERSSVLGSDKNDFRMEVYRFSDNFAGTGQDVTLRFDLTVPLSRVMAAYPELVKPFKRYQIGSVWRKEKPQAGRFREFTQLDADIVGSDSILSDSEIISLMYETMKSLGLENFIIRFNNRKILNGLPQVARFDAKRAMDVFQIMDKLDKVGIEEVIKELQLKPLTEFDEEALNLSDESVAKIKKFLAISGDSKSIIDQLKIFFSCVSIAQDGITECEQIIENIKFLGIPQENWKFDLSVARGLGYYTGPVFETTLTDIPGIGSVFSGGRFDDLIMRFTGERIPAVGASVGVDRLFAALEKLGKIQKKQSVSKVLLTIIDERYSKDIIKMAQGFRNADVNAEVFLGKDRSLKNQLAYALKKEIPFIIILGEEEKKQEKVKLKDLNKREEMLLTESEAFAKLSKATGL
jgi:histidyl-tRNA synthetase